MECLNSWVRDRENVMRRLKKVDTPILTGYQIHHNCMRPDEGLNCRMSVEVWWLESRDNEMEDSHREYVSGEALT